MPSGLDKFVLPVNHIDGAQLPNDILQKLNLSPGPDEGPDLSKTQLMILALLSAPNRKLNLCSIVQWVHHNFPSYARDHRSCTSRFSSQEQYSIVRNPCLCELSFYDALNKLDAPFRFDSRGGKVLSLLHGEYARKLYPLPLLPAVSVDELPGIHPHADGDRFHKWSELPEEIQLQIMEMALTLDQPEPTIECGDFESKSRSWVFGPKTFAITVDGRRITSQDPNQLMALCSVNKDFHEECVKIFFKRYTFKFSDTEAMRVFLSGLGANRRSLVRKVILEYLQYGNASRDKDNAYQAFRQLAEAGRLEEVKLCMVDINQAQRWGMPSFTNPSNLPGLLLLSKFRGLKSVKIEGNVPPVAAFLSAMTQPKKKESVWQPVSTRAQLLQKDVCRVKARMKKAGMTDDEITRMTKAQQALVDRLTPNKWLPPSAPAPKKAGPKKTDCYEIKGWRSDISKAQLI